MISYKREAMLKILSFYTLLQDVAQNNNNGQSYKDVLNLEYIFEVNYNFWLQV